MIRWFRMTRSEALPVKLKILWFTPHSIAEILGNLRQLGGATGRSVQAEELNAAADARYYCCGHWVPDMVELAGGEDAHGTQRRGFRPRFVDGYRRVVTGDSNRVSLR